jgi:hypothetical protein
MISFLDRKYFLPRTAACVKTRTARETRSALVGDYDGGLLVN